MARAHLLRWAAAACLAALAVGALVLDRLYPPELGRIATVGSRVLDRNGRLLALLPAPGGVWRLRTDAADVSPVFLRTLLATEDRNFWWHPGIDPLALLRAAAADVVAGRIVSGGSTLTMQAARLLHPRPRGWGAKAVEMLRALQLEAHFSKHDILRIWLTLAPFGGNIEGVTAASYAWFGVPPAALDAAQAGLLVAIPRRPEALRPDRHPAQALALRDRILAATGGEPGPLPMRRLAMPRHAGPVLAGPPTAERIATTLDLPLQAALERFSGKQLATLPEHASLAILVADAPAREFRALVSGDGRPGTLDLTRALRSPGSALKPAVYGIAFQDGIAAPGTVLDDLPRRFGAYAPEDFDRGFAGQVTAAEALRRSLNLPAVALLEKLGPLRFAEALRAAGIRLRLPPGAAPSLPLALGGAGISPRTLAALYAALATDGAVAPLSLLAGTPPAPAPLFSPRVARAVADVLTRPFPAGGPDGVAWKTGTSWGGRDAWAAGFDARHVVVVWVGRPDGTPLPGATGLGTALPLLARVIAMLPAAPRPTPAPVPAERVAASAPPADSLRLLFPPPGAVLSGDGPITLRAMGGRRPLTFMVDGAPLPGEPARREVSWQPSAPGFFRVAVLDADGQTAHATVRVR